MNMQHFEINEKQRKIVIFGNFEISPRRRGSRKFKPDHIVTKAMVQAIFMPNMISIKAVFIVL
jgi:hypothetical protein